MKVSLIHVSHKMKVSYVYQNKKQNKIITKDSILKMDDASQINIRIYDEDFEDGFSIFLFFLKYIFIGMFCLFINSLHSSMKSFCYTDNIIDVCEEVDCSCDDNGVLSNSIETKNHFVLFRTFLTIGSILFFIVLIFLVGWIIQSF